MDNIEPKCIEEQNEEWNLGLYPEEEEELRKEKEIQIKDDFNQKIEFEEKVVEKKSIVTIDRRAISSKEYLLREYRGKCQICHEKIELQNGKKIISVYHIQEGRNKENLKDREFNILGLCPNCFIKAKYGGRDFSNLIKYSAMIEEGDFFPEEVEDFKGDYYVVPIMINGCSSSLTISKNQMSNFVAFFKISKDDGVQ